MSFNPNLPLDGAVISAAELRTQYTALAELINAVPAGPAGPTGPQGDPGQPFAQAVVDSVLTLPAGNPASVSVSFDGLNVHFNFQLPQGAAGEVTQAQLDGVVAGVLNSTGNGSNGVSTLDPAMPLDLVLLRDKLNDLILALRRS